MAEQQMISAVASSSNSSSMVSSKRHGVFISFRGKDTRRNIVSHLYDALKRRNVITFIDEDGLQSGDEIPLTLNNAIQDSLLSIIIFSKNYASSKWCLGELSMILKCKKDQDQDVIPVFHDIVPSDVRNQTGSYEQAFAAYEGDPKCTQWRDELKVAANLSGYNVQEFRNEAEFLKVIVGDVLQKLSFGCPNQVEGLIGIQENYDLIKPLLNRESDKVKTLGIWGMGGIGKTALATFLFAEAKQSDQFEGSCFLEDVRVKSDGGGLQDLCNKLFSVLFDNENLFPDAPLYLSQFLKDRFRFKKVFIVLDDVDTSKQFENLMKYNKYLGPGSRVVVTTRNKQILTVDEIYEVKELNSVNSLQLLRSTAFGEKQPEDEYKDLLGEVISYCKGIPLALTNVGESLRTRSKGAWKSALIKLQKIPNTKTYDVLKLSYDGLDRLEKYIFLDIACFFRGWDKDRVTFLLGTFEFFPEIGLENLLDKALITISNGNQIEMHDLIQQVGWEIVHQESIEDPGRRSRLCNHEEMLNVLKNNLGTEVVEGLILDLSKLSKDLRLKSNSFEGMTKMRFLQIHGRNCSNKFNVYLPDGLDSLSDKLRYLQWDGFSLEYLPNNFCAEQLVELHMTHSKLKKLWDGHQNLPNLKQIDLYGSRDLIDIPDLSQAEKLESVSLGHCESLCQLHVHSKSLCVLNIYGCSSLKKFSVTSEEMMPLDLSNTTICALPSSIWGNRKLNFVCISGCESCTLPRKRKTLNVYTKRKKIVS